MDFALTREQEDFRQKIKGFLQQELAPFVEEIERAACFPMSFYKRLAAYNLLALNFPKQ